MQWTDLPGDNPVLSLADTLRTEPFTAAHRILSLLEEDTLIVFPDNVRAAILEHISTSWVEMGGLLLGRVTTGIGVTADGGRTMLLEITGCVPSIGATGTRTYLTMDTAVWNAAREALHPDEVIIGWFHSHPNLGAFFSGTDLRTQRAFFANDYSIGFVMDWVRHEEAWFLGPMARQIPPERIARHIRFNDTAPGEPDVAPPPLTAQ
ncbi:MAG: Mov34/MPN/PAD-1 family protein [Methylobacteriaceae bacterium]|jgi:proteasome lid subunit RPN8/RPN11|nr:Mov34/MPN/PAD-1 family protein [Methylobacteriaceae bacterium]